MATRRTKKTKKKTTRTGKRALRTAATNLAKRFAGQQPLRDVTHAVALAMTERALDVNDDNVTRAAAMLGTTRQTLLRILKKKRR